MKLSIVIHTEEEFDWSKGFSTNNIKVTHGKELYQVCEELISYGAYITLAIDWAFLHSSDGKYVIHNLKEKHSSKVEFAAHLHPWVNPPFADESKGEVQEIDTYPGNLPFNLEYEKLKRLTEEIEMVTGVRPECYLAGRYGIGANTYNILNKLKYVTDVSVSPFTNFSSQHGPDFSSHTNQEKKILGVKCLPHTTGYISHFSFFSMWLNKTPNNLKILNTTVIGKIILRLANVKKIRLSPEGTSKKQNIKLAKALTRIGVEHLIYSFHSSSCILGGSPYTNTAEKLKSVNQTNTQTILALLKLLKPSLTSQ